MSAPATHVEDQLLDFAYGELSERDARSVQAHLSSCTQCQGALDDIQGVRKVMSKLPPSEAPNDGLDSLLAYAEQAARRVQAGPAPKKTWWRALILPLGGVAAAAIFFIVGQEVSKDSSLKQAAHQAAVAKVAGESQAPSAPAEPAPVVAAAPAPDQAELRKSTEVPEGAIAQPLLDAQREEARANFREDAAEQKPSAGPAAHAHADEKLEERQSRAKSELARDEAAKAAKPAKKKAATSEVDDVFGSVGSGTLSGAGAGASAGAGRAGSGAGGFGELGARGGAPGAMDRKDAPAAAKNVESKAAADKEVQAEAPPPPPVQAAPMPAPKPSATMGKGGESAARAPATRAVDFSSLSVEGDRVARRDADERVAEMEATTDSAPAREVAAAPAARDAEAKALLDQALAANKAHRYDDAIHYSRQALALAVDDVRLRQGALNVLCEAESELTGNLTACEALVRDYPSSGAAKMARSRIASVRARGTAATGAPAARPPYATEKRAAEPASAPADATQREGDSSN